MFGLTRVWTEWSYGVFRFAHLVALTHLLVEVTEVMVVGMASAA